MFDVVLWRCKSKLLPPLEGGHQWWTQLDAADHLTESRRLGPNVPGLAVMEAKKGSRLQLFAVPFPVN